MNDSTEHQTVPDAPGAEAEGGGDARGAVPDTRQALLDAGLELFSTRGYDGASVRAITRRAQANLGAITYHFGSKRAFYGAVLEREIRPLARRVLGASEGPGTALDRIERVVLLYFAHLREHPHLPRLLLQEIAAGRQPPEPVLQVMRGVAASIASLQYEGQRDGSVRPGHPLLTALSILSQPIYMNLVAPMIREALGLDITSDDELPAVTAHAADFVRHGLTPRPPEGAPAP